jgi:hypothetical protein
VNNIMIIIHHKHKSLVIISKIRGDQKNINIKYRSKKSEIIATDAASACWSSVVYPGSSCKLVIDDHHHIPPLALCINIYIYNIL